MVKSTKMMWIDGGVVYQEWIGLLCLMTTCALHLGEEAIKLRNGSNEHAHIPQLSHVTSTSNSLHVSNPATGYTAIDGQCINGGHVEGVL